MPGSSFHESTKPSIECLGGSQTYGIQVAHSHRSSLDRQVLEHSRNQGEAVRNNKSSLSPPWQIGVTHWARRYSDWVSKASCSVAWGCPSAEKEARINPINYASRFNGQWHEAQWRDAAAIGDGPYSSNSYSEPFPTPPDKNNDSIIGVIKYNKITYTNWYKYFQTHSKTQNTGNKPAYFHETKYKENIPTYFHERNDGENKHTYSQHDKYGREWETNISEDKLQPERDETYIYMQNTQKTENNPTHSHTNIIHSGFRKVQHWFSTQWNNIYIYIY